MLYEFNTKKVVMAEMSFRGTSNHEGRNQSGWGNLITIDPLRTWGNGRTTCNLDEPMHRILARGQDTGKMERDELRQMIWIFYKAEAKLCRESMVWCDVNLIWWREKASYLFWLSLRSIVLQDVQKIHTFWSGFLSGTST